ncbi:MAG: hypothetical protein IJC68_01695 [Firmicutes bacterium]|jgi:hypothetical protein|nr:hypothetical protein [Bacillota bacterium]
MYAIRESAQKINGVVVDTFERQVHTEDAVLRVEAGTTGPTGGDRSSGSRTFLDLTVLYGDFLIEPEREEDGKVIGVRIASCGDDGLEALMKALDFSLHAYVDQCSGEDD